MADRLLNRLFSLNLAKDGKGTAPNKPPLLAIPHLISSGLITPAILFGFDRLPPNLSSQRITGSDPYFFTFGFS
jgi:hypothetical protein